MSLIDLSKKNMSLIDGVLSSIVKKILHLKFHHILSNR